MGDAVGYYRAQSASTGDAMLPFEPKRVAGLSAAEFSRFTQNGVPIVITDGLRGTGMDVEKNPEAWSCHRIAERFPTARMKKEYAAQEKKGEENPIKMKEFETQLGQKTRSGAKDPKAPQFAPLY